MLEIFLEIILSPNIDLEKFLTEKMKKKNKLKKNLKILAYGFYVFAALLRCVFFGFQKVKDR